MEDQKQTDAAQAAAEHDQAPMPANHVAEIAQPEAIIHLGISEKGALTIAGLYGGVFNPGQNVAHAFMQMVEQEHDYLMSRVLGRLTDADRYRALSDFAMLANTDKPRFEAVNGMIQNFEDSKNIPPENLRGAVDHMTMANFIFHALLETAPADLTEQDVARIAAAEEKRERKAQFKILNASGTGTIQ